MKKHLEKLETESIVKLVIKNSVPAILANLVFIFYNIVDRIFIGKFLGTDALAGVSLTFPFFTFFVSLGILVGIGSGVLVSIKLGEKNYEYADKIIGNVIIIYLSFSLLISITGLFFLDEILIYFGATPATFGYAKDYVGMILPFVFFQFIGMGMNHIVRAESNAKKAMLTVLIASLVNIILDPIFIFVFKMGVSGAALATVISMLCSSLWIIHHFIFSKNSVLKLKLHDINFDFGIIKSIFYIGFPAFFMQFMASIITVIFNKNLVFYGGDIAVGAMGIINTIFMIVFMLLVGLCQGSQPIMGYNYGAKNFLRVRQTLLTTLVFTFFITVPFFLLINIFPKAIVSLFIKNDLVLMNLAVLGLKRFMSMIILVGFNVLFIQYLQATGKPKEAMFLNILRQIIILIPLVIFLPQKFGLEAIWFSGPITDILAFMIIFVIFLKHLKNLKLLTKNSKEIMISL